MKAKKINKWNIFFLTILYLGFTITAIDKAYLPTNIKIMSQGLLSIVSFIFFVVKYYGNYGLKIFFPKLTINKIILLIWFLFSTQVVISSTINGQVSLNSFIYLTVIPILFFLIIPVSLVDPIRELNYAILLSNLLMLIYNFILTYQDINNVVAYEGIVANPNSLGIIAMQACISSSFIIFEYLKENKKLIKLFIVLLSFGFSLYILVSTGSRTSIISLIVMEIIFFYDLFRFKNIKFYKIIPLIVLGAFFYFYLLDDVIYEFVIQKFINTSQVNLVSDRNVVWELVINNAEFFGHGEKYFLNVIGLEGHNIFIQTLGYYGIVAMILQIIFFILVLFSSLKYFSSNGKDLVAIYPFIFIIGFLVLGMGESIFGAFQKNPAMSLYNICGILIYNCNLTKNGR